MSFFRLLRRDSQINGSELQCGISMPSEHPRREKPSTLSKLAVIAGLALSPTESGRDASATSFERTTASLLSNEAAAADRVRAQISQYGTSFTRTSAESAQGASAATTTLDSSATESPSETAEQQGQRIAREAVEAFYHPEAPNFGTSREGGTVEEIAGDLHDDMMAYIESRFSSADLDQETPAVRAAYDEVLRLMGSRVTELGHEAGTRDLAICLSDLFRDIDTGDMHYMPIIVPEGQHVAVLDSSYLSMNPGEAEVIPEPETLTDEPQTLDPTLAQR